MFGFVSAVTLVLTTGALIGARPLLAKWGMVDVPNHRSSHDRPTLRGGGLGIVIGLIAGLGAAGSTPAVESGTRLLIVGLVIGLYGAIGFLDDRLSLPVATRLVAQAALALVGVVTLTRVVPLSPALAAVSMVLLIFYVNAANFMDGINGISGQHGLIAGMYFAVLGSVQGSPLLSLVGCAVAWAFASFLPWNAGRSALFMGDSGSYTLGAAVSVMSLLAFGAEATPLAVAAPLLIYSSDVVFTLIRRARRRVSLTEAHREHVYQQVQRLTRSHASASLLCSLLTAACCVLGLLSATLPSFAFVYYSLTVGVVVAYLAAPSWMAFMGWHRISSPAPDESSGSVPNQTLGHG